jgi:hypothetical protein
VTAFPYLEPVSFPHQQPERADSTNPATPPKELFFDLIAEVMALTFSNAWELAWTGGGIALIIGGFYNSPQPVIHAQHSERQDANPISDSIRTDPVTYDEVVSHTEVGFGGEQDTSTRTIVVTATETVALVLPTNHVDIDATNVPA